MRILVCNDDGVQSPLIKILAKALTKYGEVIVCAPTGNRSAMSQAINYWDFSADKLKYIGCEDNIKYYSHPYTPTDSVKYILEFTNFKPDLVVSGINNGLNVGMDAYYSGTVGIATEGALNGIDSVAFSIHKDYEENTLDYLDEILQFVLVNKLASKDYVLNVNIPKQIDTLKYEFTCLKTHMSKALSDEDVINENKVSLSALYLDRTNYEVLEELKKTNFDNLSQK